MLILGLKDHSRSFLKMLSFKRKEHKGSSRKHDVPSLHEPVIADGKSGFGTECKNNSEAGLASTSGTAASSSLYFSAHSDNMRTQLEHSTISGSSKITRTTEANPDAELGLTPNSMPSSSPHSSDCSKDMITCTRDFASDLEFEIESSKIHWSDVESIQGAALAEKNREVFKSLKEQWGGFFKEWYGKRLVVGQKLAEGGQAEIFEAAFIVLHNNSIFPKYVVKVFKTNTALQDLQSQWPHGMLKSQKSGDGYFFTSYTCLLYGGTLLEDGRFAFLMKKAWGDLRKLINLKMEQRNHQGPPFSNKDAILIMLTIGRGMQELHDLNIVHRDLKASNVLVSSDRFRVGEKFDPHNLADANYFIADFECSVGTMGTGFWRAPEILLALANRRVPSALFSEKADVYSYGMTCYEILTGLIPFQGMPSSETRNSIVYDGLKPMLPSYVISSIRTLLSQCWHPDPTSRPTFGEIVDELKCHEK